VLVTNKHNPFRIKLDQALPQSTFTFLFSSAGEAKQQGPDQTWRKATRVMPLKIERIAMDQVAYTTAADLEEIGGDGWAGF